jgi:hypothetical protein
MVGNRTEIVPACQSCKHSRNISRRRGLLFGMLAKTSIPLSVVVKSQTEEPGYQLASYVIL